MSLPTTPRKNRLSLWPFITTRRRVHLVMDGMQYEYNKHFCVVHSLSFPFAREGFFRFPINFPSDL